MGLKFGNLAIKGIDVSQFQGSIQWDQAANMHSDFGVIRVGAGKTTDTKFVANWANAKPHVFRIAYWYMDYYSNYFPTSSVYGMSDEEWGKVQADNCWNKIKSDPAYVFLDIESASASTAAPITNFTSRAQRIARAFLERMDVLNGKTNGIYCSLGLLTWFGAWFKTRPLWVAWYNEVMVVNGLWVERTIDSVKAAVRSKGWLGKILMWQYTSDGDVDDNGFGDGVLYGMDSNALDLNAWVESKEEFQLFKGGAVIPEPTPTVIIPNLEIPSFSQNNTVWKNEQLGTSDRTIGSDGCLLSCVAAMCHYFGKATDPAVLNRDLNRVKGYETLNLLVYDAVTAIYPDIVVDWSNFLKDAEVTDAKIDAVVQSKRPVIVQVDAVPATSVLDQHWVVLIGKDSGGYIMMDPIDGATLPFKSRYSKVLRMVVYSHTPAVPPVVVSDAEKLARLWNAHPEIH